MKCTIFIAVPSRLIRNFTYLSMAYRKIIPELLTSHVKICTSWVTSPFGPLNLPVGIQN